MSLVNYSPLEYPPAPAPRVRPSWLEVMDRGVELAEIIANTDFVPRGLRGNQPAILAAILYGHEVGLEPMQSLSKIAVIDGRPSMAAEAQRALILAAGHELWPEDVTNTRATMAGRRTGSKQTVRVTWTIDDARRARIAGKPNWQAYPRQMLVARATAELARQIFADVIGGMAATEELADIDELDQQPEPEPAARTRRRRRPTAAAGGSGAALPSAEPEPRPQPAEPDAAAEPNGSAQQETTDEPPADPPPSGALRRMFAAFRAKGLGGDEQRAARLAYSENVLGRKIASSTELSALDVSRIIETLEQDEQPLPEPEQQTVEALQTELDAQRVDEPPPPLPDDDDFPPGY